MLLFLILSAPVMQNYYEGDISFRVQIWGEVRSPGIYAVPPTTNIVEAISFAGGPTSRSDLTRVKLVSALRERNITFYNVEAYINGDKKNPPILDSGDLIYVPTSLSSRMWDFVRFVGIVAGAAYSIYRITE